MSCCASRFFIDSLRIYSVGGRTSSFALVTKFATICRVLFKSIDLSLSVAYWLNCSFVIRDFKLIKGFSIGNSFTVSEIILETVGLFFYTTLSCCNNLLNSLLERSILIPFRVGFRILLIL